MHFLIHLSLLSICILTGCNGPSEKLYPFVNEQNQEVFDLEVEILEISGIASNTNGFWAIEDEGGWIYRLDQNSFQILDKVKFAWPGDYEAISTAANGGLLVIDSRGVAYELIRENEEWVVESIWSIPDYKMEFEGVWQDLNSGVLYLVGKKPGKKVENTFERYIWAFDPKDASMSKTIPLPIEKIWSRMLEFQYFNSWKPGANKELPFSDLTQDPANKNWLVLCSNPASIIVLSPKGQLLDVVELDQVLLPQAEAICFDRQGNLVITSEGLLGPARAVRYKKGS